MYSSSSDSVIEDSRSQGSQDFNSFDRQAGLVRHGTLLSANATPGRNAAELNSILGGSNARLKPGASLLPAIGQGTCSGGTLLEQAKFRARVELDLVLYSKTCVQGGYLQGHVKILVPKCAKNELPVMISGGKIRVVGFEAISKQRDRYPFYQCSSPLLTTTATTGGLSDFHDDAEGFAWAMEGEHAIPFAIHLPICMDYGAPKGVIQIQSGVAVRYIAMVSIKIKDSISDERSIAHFYRDCEIWPRLDPSIILAPAQKPLQVTVLKSLFLGGSGKVELTASVHRSYWVAGQQCFVILRVLNSSRKPITSLTLSLIRTTVIYKPNQHFDTLQDGYEMDPDACQTSTSHKEVAESVLEMRQRGTRGHASAKGWWGGVPPAETLDFSHSIFLPPDALTVMRGRLLEIEYSIRVTLSAGTLRTSEMQTSIPIKIVNFLSLDPQPNPSARNAAPEQQYAEDKKPPISAPLKKPHGMRPLHAEETPSSCDSDPKSFLSNTSAPTISSIGQGLLGSISEHEAFPAQDDHDGVWYEEYMLQPIASGEEPNGNELLGLAMYEDDNETSSYVLHVDPDFENAPRFADLYHASVDDLCCYTSSGPQEDMHQRTANFGPQGPSSFARRVQAKIDAAASASSPRIDTTDTLSSRNSNHQCLGHAIAYDSVTSTSSAENPAPTVLDPNIYCTGGDHPPVSQDEQGQDHKLDCKVSSLAYEQTVFPVLQTSHPMVPNLWSLTSRRNTEPIHADGASVSSRLLPKPPSIAAVPFGVMSSTAIEESTALPTYAPPYIALHHDYETNCVFDDRDRLEMDGQGSDHVEIVTVADAYPVLMTRPSISTLRDNTGAGLGGSSTSVKERIKELEERQRMLELNEA